MNFELIEDSIQEGTLDLDYFNPDRDSFSVLLGIPFLLKAFDETESGSLIGKGVFSLVHDVSKIRVGGKYSERTLDSYMNDLSKVHTVVYEVLEVLSGRKRAHGDLIARLHTIASEITPGYDGSKEELLMDTLKRARGSVLGRLEAPKHLVRKLYGILHSAELTGSFIPTEYALRVEAPCRGKQRGLKWIVCAETDAPGGPRDVEYIPFLKGETVVLPSYVAAGTIGSVLNSLQDETEVFAMVYGTFVHRVPYAAKNKRAPLTKSYTFIEKAMPLFDVVKTKADFYSLVFDIVHGLYIAQGRYEFAHNDLHAGNILATPHDGTGRMYCYGTGSGRTKCVIGEHQSAIAKIVDYGTARLCVGPGGAEGSTILISQHRNLASFNSGDYTPEYDILTLVGPGLFLEYRREVESLLSATEYAELFRIVTGAPITGRSYGDILGEMGALYRGYRPTLAFQRSVARLGSSGTFHATILDSLILLINSLEGSMKFAETDSDRVLPVVWSPPVPLYYADSGKGFGKLSDLVSLTKANAKRRKELLQRNKQDWGVPWFRVYQGSPYEVSSALKKQSGGRGANDRRSRSTVHVALIDMNALRAYKKENYTFNTSCCGSHPLDFLREESGVVINGSFFDSRMEYVPIRSYSQLESPRDSLKKRVFPQKGSVGYDSDFGLISIPRGGMTIRISNERGGGANYFESAPILAYPGATRKDLVSRFQDTQYQGGVGEVYKYKCDNVGPGKRVTKKGRQIFISDRKGSYAQNCGTIEPGNLSHGMNPNPRSMLALIGDPQNPSYVALIVADGDRNVTIRDSKNETGLTFEDLVDLAALLGAKKAINLDGGSSSNICWSFGGGPSGSTDQPVYCTSSFDHLPVGNLLAVSTAL